MTPWWVWAGVLLLVALLHGAASGIRVASGRDGKISYRPSEGRGAVRGMLVVSALMVPYAALAAMDAATTVRLEVHTQAWQAMALAYGPVAGLTAVAFVLARTAPWQVRVYVNSVVLGGVEFVRPLVAWAGVGAAGVVTRDITVTVLCALAVTAGLLVTRVMRWWWYPPLSAVVTPLPSEAPTHQPSSVREREAG